MSKLCISHFWIPLDIVLPSFYLAAHRFILDGMLTGRRLRRPELSKAMRRKVRASEILFGKKKWVGNTVGGSGIRRVFPPGMYKTEVF